MKSIKKQMIFIVALISLCVLVTSNAFAATYSAYNWRYGYTTLGSVDLVTKITDYNTYTELWYASNPDSMYIWRPDCVDVTALYWDGSDYDNYKTVYNCYDDYVQEFPYTGAQSTGKLYFYNRLYYGDYMKNKGTFY